MSGLVLVQAVLAGQFLYAEAGLVAVHRVIAEALPLVSAALCVALWFRREEPRGRKLFAAAVGVTALLIVQTGLGFAGRTSTGSAAIHVPLGVLIFGGTVSILVMIETRSPRRVPPYPAPADGPAASTYRDPDSA
jgi:heme A synthase